MKLLRHCFRVVVGLLCLGVIAWPFFARAAEIYEVNWLSDRGYLVTKESDLPDNTEPFSYGVDCGGVCYGTVSSGQYVNGSFNNGKDGWGRLMHGILFPAPSATIVTKDMITFGVFKDIVPSEVASSMTQNGRMYTINRSWDMKITSAKTGNAVRIGIDSRAYSNNGKWMVTTGSDPSVGSGLMLFDTTNFRGKYIASFNVYTTLNGGNITPGRSNLAVSDDGRFIASGWTQPSKTDGTKEFGLRVYDTSTCDDQFGAKSPRAYCTYKNIWTGKINGGVSSGAGINDQIEGNPERPLNIRFKDDTTITFSAVHDYVSKTDYKASTYRVELIKPKEPEKTRLLAMGDSYISGEGAEFALGNKTDTHYISGTNTSNNKCHQSDLSYPYLLAAKYAREFHSVACSGAVMANIYSGLNDHLNQLIDKKLQRSYINQDKQLFLSNFSLGAIEQYNFISSTEPNTILLSIGGNDIGFSDIVKRCVLSIAGDPCYQKRSERKSLLMTIYGKHQALKDTYDKILSESTAGTKLFVMGYPQVLNPTGNCGANVHFDDQERQFAKMLIDRMNMAVKNATEASGAVYVDISDSLTGHRLCDTNDDGVNGLTDGDDGFHIGLQIGDAIHSLGVANESYHPTTLGHQLISSAVSNETDNLTKESPGVKGSSKLMVSDDDEFIVSGTPDTAAARKITFQNITKTVVTSVGKGMKLSLSAARYALKAGSVYRVVFHSDEVEVAKGIVQENEAELNIEVPHLSPGLHSLHIYAEDIEGEPIDIAQDIYIVASDDDYDGDGVNNEDDDLPLINETGKVITKNDLATNIYRTDEPSNLAVALQKTITNQVVGTLTVVGERTNEITHLALISTQRSMKNVFATSDVVGHVDTLPPFVWQSAVLGSEAESVADKTSSPIKQKEKAEKRTASWKVYLMAATTIGVIGVIGVLTIIVSKRNQR